MQQKVLKDENQHQLYMKHHENMEYTFEQDSLDQCGSP